MLGRRGAFALDAVRKAVLPPHGLAPDLDPLIDRIGDASLVLHGEAAHGTHAFHLERTRAVEPLERAGTPSAEPVEVPETWPSGA